MTKIASPKKRAKRRSPLPRPRTAVPPTSNYSHDGPTRRLAVAVVCFLFLPISVAADDRAADTIADPQEPATIIVADLRVAAVAAAADGDDNRLVSIYRRMGLLFELSGDFEAAAAAYDEAQTHSDRSELLVRAGMMYVELGDNIRASARARKAAENWNGDDAGLEDLAILVTRLEALAGAGLGPSPGVEIEVPEIALSDRLAYILHGESTTDASPEAFLSSAVGETRDTAASGPFVPMPTPWYLTYGVTGEGEPAETFSGNGNSGGDAGPTAIQVGSFVVEQNAADLVAVLEAKGFGASVVAGRETADGGRYHRVVVPVHGGADAQPLMTSLREAGHEGYFFFGELSP